MGKCIVLSLAGGGNVNYYKTAHHPLLKGIWNILAIFSKSVSKWISKFSFQLGVQVYSLLAQAEGERKAFLRGARRRTALWDYLQEYLVVIRDEKVSPFVKFEIILLLLCFLLDPLTNKSCRAWRSKIKLWIDFRTYQK